MNSVVEEWQDILVSILKHHPDDIEDLWMLLQVPPAQHHRIEQIVRSAPDKIRRITAGARSRDLTHAPNGVTTDVRIVAAYLLKNRIKDVDELDVETVAHGDGAVPDAVNEKTRLQDVVVEFVGGYVGFRGIEPDGGTGFWVDELGASGCKWQMPMLRLQVFIQNGPKREYDQRP